MKANNLNQIPALEIASQIEEITKDRVLLEREIDLYFEELDKYNLNKIFLLKLKGCVIMGNVLDKELQSHDASGIKETYGENLIQKIKNAMEEGLWKIFKKNTFSCIEKDASLTKTNKEYMKSLTEIVIIKAKQYGHAVLHQIKEQYPSLLFFLSQCSFLRNKRNR